MILYSASLAKKTYSTPPRKRILQRAMVLEMGTMQLLALYANILRDYIKLFKWLRLECNLYAICESQQFHTVIVHNNRLINFHILRPFTSKITTEI